MPGRSYSDQELDAALASITAPGRLAEAQNMVLRTAPSLQRLLASALSEGGWFDLGHAQAVHQAVGAADPLEREREVQTLVAEETRLGMMVGVAVGFELARELNISGESAADGEAGAADEGAGEVESAGAGEGGAVTPAETETTHQED